MDIQQLLNVEIWAARELAKRVLPVIVLVMPCLVYICIKYFFRVPLGTVPAASENTCASFLF